MSRGKLLRVKYLYGECPRGMSVSREYNTSAQCDGGSKNVKGMSMGKLSRVIICRKKNVQGTSVSSETVLPARCGGSKKCEGNLHAKLPSVKCPREGNANEECLFPAKTIPPPSCDGDSKNV